MYSNETNYNTNISHPTLFPLDRGRGRKGKNHFQHKRMLGFAFGIKGGLAMLTHKDSHSVLLDLYKTEWVPFLLGSVPSSTDFSCLPFQHQDRI